MITENKIEFIENQKNVNRIVECLRIRNNNRIKQSDFYLFKFTQVSADIYLSENLEIITLEVYNVEDAL